MRLAFNVAGYRVNDGYCQANPRINAGSFPVRKTSSVSTLPGIWIRSFLNQLLGRKVGVFPLTDATRTAPFE